MMKTDAVIRLCKLLNREPPTDWGKEVEDLLNAASDEIERINFVLDAYVERGR